MCTGGWEKLYLLIVYSCVCVQREESEYIVVSFYTRGKERGYV